MRSAQDIITKWPQLYTELPMPKVLVLHHVRVAVVADVICANWTGPKLNRDRVVAACLLHDIGNILKMRLDSKEQQDLMRGESKPIAYWKGQLAHAKMLGDTPEVLRAHYLRELSVEPTVIELIERTKGKDIRDIIATNDYEAMLCLYSDNRVAITSVCSLADRIADIKHRYPGYYQRTERRDAKLDENLWVVQELLQSYTNTDLDSINERTVNAHPLRQRLNAQ